MRASNKSWISRLKTSGPRLWLVLLAAVFATCVNAPRTRSNEAAVAAGTPPPAVKSFYCGYDPRGADDEVSNHRMNILRRSDSLGGVSLTRLQKTGPLADDADISLLQDDGTLVIPPSKFNLKNRAILFTPDASSEGVAYRISSAELEFSGDFGTRLSFFFGVDGSDDADNGYREVDLGTTSFPFFGVAYDKLFIGTNGYITFTQGDTAARISVSALGTELPRIAPLWADLDVSSAGNIYYNRLGDRHIITWNKASQPSYDGASTCQAVLYDDGRIAFVYKKVKAQTALVGISPGNSTTSAQPIDFSNPPNDKVAGPLFETFAKEKRLDIQAILRAFYSTHSDSFDTVYVWTNFAFDNGQFVAHTFNIRNTTNGIGLPIFSRGEAYGSNAQLGSIIAMGNVGDWPKNPDANMAGLNSAISIVCHEQGHLWLAYVRFAENHQAKDNLLGRQDSHWSFLVDTRTTTDGGYSSLMEGNSWRDSGGGVFTTSESAVNYFTPLDEYLMGLRAANDVGDIPYLVTDPQLTEYLHEKSPTAGFSMTATRKIATISQIVEREGPRIPDVSAASKVFRIAFIVVTEPNSIASAAELKKITDYREALIRYFSRATEGRGSLYATLNQ